MILLIAVVIMLVVAYAHSQEGLFNGAAICFGVLFSGVVAFNYWPALADILEDFFALGMLDSCEDAIALIALFCITLGLVRAILMQIAPGDIDLPAAVDQLGGAVFGLVSGYLVSGFLICALQTLPWHENFLGFEPRSSGSSWNRRLMPSDEFWIRSMLHFHRTSLKTGVKKEDKLDSYFLNFEPDFAQHRRVTEHRGPLPWPPPPSEDAPADAPPPKPAEPAAPGEVKLRPVEPAK